MEKDKEMKINAGMGIWKTILLIMVKAKLPWGWVIFSIVFGFSIMTVELLIPDFTQKIVSGNLSRNVITIMILLAISSPVLMAIGSFIDQVAIAKIDQNFRKFIWKRMLRAPIASVEQNKARELVSRVTADTQLLSLLIVNHLGGLFAHTYFFIGTFIILLSYDYRLAVSQLILVPIMIVIIIWFGRLTYTVRKELQDRLAMLTQHLAEVLSNIPLIKIFVTENKEKERGNKIIRLYYKTSFKSGLLTTSQEMLMAVLRVIGDAIVIGLGLYYVSKGVFTIDIWIAFFLYADGLFQAIMKYVFTFIIIKDAQGSAERVARFVLESEEDYIRTHELTDNKNAISFEDVSFCYGDKKGISNVSFTIPNGKTTAIIGPSGAGKTTIFSLLEQFFQPTAGCIKYGNKPISEIHLHDWRKAFAYVSQDSPLLSGSIRDNIMYGVDREVSEAELRSVTQSANALPFIEEFPHGFDEEVGEGGIKLSGGQRQRIAIARALLMDAPFLLLDEATASLDTHSEQIVQNAIHKAMTGRTTIVVTHNLATVIDADQVILLQSGQISGVGSHKELLETNELYKEFVKSSVVKNVS